MKCTKCTAKYTAKTNAYLCKRCADELWTLLTGMPKLVSWLQDSAIGNTKIGGGEKSRGNAYQSQTPALNQRAVDLLDHIHATLGEWASSLAYSLATGIPVRSGARPDSGDYARFLAGQIMALVRDPDVAELLCACSTFVKRGVTVINPRIPPTFCGPCPTQITDHRHCTDCGDRHHECATRLLARRGAVEVICPQCKTTHNVAALVNHLLARADNFRCTIPEMYRVLVLLGERVPLDTLYRWAQPKGRHRGSGQLRPAGYLRPDKKRIGPTRHSDKDQPVYRVADARKLWKTKNEGKQRK